jgi:hypothetical protein
MAEPPSVTKSGAQRAPLRERRRKPGPRDESPSHAGGMASTGMEDNPFDVTNSLRDGFSRFPDQNAD